MEPSLVADSSGMGTQLLKAPQPAVDAFFFSSENAAVTTPIIRNGKKEQAIFSRGESKSSRNPSNRNTQQKITSEGGGFQKNQCEVKRDSLSHQDQVKTLERNALEKSEGLSKENCNVMDKVDGEKQEEIISQQIHSIRQQKGKNGIKKHPILLKNQQHQEAFTINNNNNGSTVPDNSSNCNQDNKCLPHDHLVQQQHTYSPQSNELNQQQQKPQQLSQYANAYSFIPLAINQPPHQQQPRLQLPTIVVAPRSQRPSSSVLKNYSSTLDITQSPPYREPSCFQIKDQSARLTKNIVINVLSNHKKTCIDEYAQSYNRNMPISQENNNNNNCSSLESSMSFEEESSQFPGKRQVIHMQSSSVSPCSNNIFPSWHSDAKSIRKISPKMLRRQIQSKRQQKYLESIMSESQKLEALKLIALQSQSTNSPKGNPTSCKDVFSHRSASSSVKIMNKQPSQDGKQQQQMYFKIVDSGKRRHSQELAIGNSQLASARNYTHRMKVQDPLVTPQKVNAAILDKKQAGKSNHKNNKKDSSGCLNSNDISYTPQKNSIHLQILSKLISNTSNSQSKANLNSAHGRQAKNEDGIKLTRHSSATIVNITLDKSNLSIAQIDSGGDSKKVKESQNNHNNIGKSFPSNSNQGSSQTTLDIATLQEDGKEIILSSDDEASMATPYCTYSMKKQRRKQSTQIPAIIMTPSKEQLPQAPNKAKITQKPDNTNTGAMVSQLGQLHAQRKFFQKEMTSLGNEQIVQNKLEQACQGSLLVRKLDENDCEIAGIMQNRRRFQASYLDESALKDKRILHSRQSFLLDNCRSRRRCQKKQQYSQMNYEEEEDSQIIVGNDGDRQEQQYLFSEELRGQTNRSKKTRKLKRFYRDGGIEPWQIQLSDNEKQDEEDICSLGNNH